MKDYFSGHSDVYSAHRPTYPDDLFQFLFSKVRSFDTAWDCATGNGQVARFLSKQFREVIASDISQQQLDHAYQAENIRYKKFSAENTSISSNSIDLITVAQALHWFDLKKFYEEVRRVAKPDGILAVWGYGLCYCDPQTDAIITDFYNNVVGPYWDPARILVEQEYKSLDFPFREEPAPKFVQSVSWSLNHYLGYLSSWSATRAYMKENEKDPIPELREKLLPIWNTDEKTVSFPIFMRLGRV